MVTLKLGSAHFTKYGDIMISLDKYNSRCAFSDLVTMF